MSEHNTSPKAKGIRLKQLREFAGLTKVELSQKAGVGLSSISYWEDGKSNGIMMRSAAKIINSLQNEIECSLSWLYDGIGSGPKIKNSLNSDYYQIRDQSKPIQQSAALDKVDLSEVKSLIEKLRESIDGAEIVTANSDSLTPFLNVDDILLGYPLKKADIHNAIGTICFFVENGKSHIGILACFNNSLVLQLTPFFDSSKMPILIPIDSIIFKKILDFNPFIR